MIRAASRKRGQEIYQRLCINCHGDHKRPGSLPTSLRFASGRFKRELGSLLHVSNVDAWIRADGRPDPGWCHSKSTARDSLHSATHI